MNLYAYVSSDPINYFDPYGTRQCDVDAAVAACREENPHLRIPDDIEPKDFSDPTVKGEYTTYGPLDYIIGDEIDLAERYYGELTESGAGELFSTVLHEVLHANGFGNDRDPHKDVDMMADNMKDAALQTYIRNRAKLCGK